MIKGETLTDNELRIFESLSFDIVLWFDGVSITRGEGLMCIRIWILDKYCGLFRSGRSPIGRLCDVKARETSIPPWVWGMVWDTISDTVVEGGFPIGRERLQFSIWMNPDNKSANLHSGIQQVSASCGCSGCACSRLNFGFIHNTDYTPVSRNLVTDGELFFKAERALQSRTDHTQKELDDLPRQFRGQKDVPGFMRDSSGAPLYLLDAASEERVKRAQAISLTSLLPPPMHMTHHMLHDVHFSCFTYVMAVNRKKGTKAAAMLEFSHRLNDAALIRPGTTPMNTELHRVLFSHQSFLYFEGRNANPLPPRVRKINSVTVDSRASLLAPIFGVIAELAQLWSQLLYLPRPSFDSLNPDDAARTIRRHIMRCEVTGISLRFALEMLYQIYVVPKLRKSAQKVADMAAGTEGNATPRSTAITDDIYWHRLAELFVKLLGALMWPSDGLEEHGERDVRGPLVSARVRGTTQIVGRAHEFAAVEAFANRIVGSKRWVLSVI